jgi:hypothetical protein
MSKDSMDKLSVLLEANRFAAIFGVATSDSSIQVLNGGAAVGSTPFAGNCERQIDPQVNSPASSLPHSSIAAARAAGRLQMNDQET